MRQVTVMRFEQVKVLKTRSYKSPGGDTETYETTATIKVDDYKAKFHQWSTNYEEIGETAGLYPVAIVEKADGTVETPAACLIRFETDNG